jgi:hypothetical protein
MPKTIRFAEVVAKCGRPSPYLAWTRPEKDPVFLQAVKARRVLTVHQELHGGKKDFGLPGFHPETRAQYLLFPKGLANIEGRRVIAIDYELVDQAATGSSRNAPAAPKPPRQTPVPPARGVKNKAPAPPTPSVPQEPVNPADPDADLAAELRRILGDLEKGRARAARARLRALAQAQHALSRQ